MANYTSLTMSEVNEILSLYDFPHAKSMTAMSHGISNTNYLVCLHDVQDAEEKSVLLKVSNDKTHRELTDEMQIILHLSKEGFPLVVRPFLQKDASPIYTYQNHVGVIFPKAPGKVEAVNASRCQAMGAALGMLHQVPTNMATFRSYTDVGFDHHKIEKYCMEANCPKDFSAAFNEVKKSKYWEKYLTYEKQIASTPTLIHGDLYYDNVFFENDKITTLLDFEQAGLGSPMLDLGIAMTGSCLKDGVIDFDLVRAYQKGYEGVRQLIAIEKDLLEINMKIGLVSISLWRIKRFLEGDLSAEKKFSYRELLQILRLF
jgi:homoserine kinase type II